MEATACETTGTPSSTSSIKKLCHQQKMSDESLPEDNIDTKIDNLTNRSIKQSNQQHHEAKIMKRYVETENAT